MALTDFKSDGSGLILGTVGSIPTHFRQAPWARPRTTLFPTRYGVPVEDSFDLHSFSPRDIPSVVESAASH